MLNLECQEQAPTPPERVFARPPGRAQPALARAVRVDEVEPQVNPPGGSGPAAPPDPRQVAQRVWELMREELRVERERRKNHR